MSKAVCTECRYIYDSRFGSEENGIGPGRSFASIDGEFHCPHCSADKESFVEIDEEVVEVMDVRDMTDLESEHVPVYSFEDGDLVVHIGAYGSEHPQEAGHSIEWIEVLDDGGEVLERAYFLPGQEVEARFLYEEWDVFEIRACCSEHGTWKWVFYGDLDL